MGRLRRARASDAGFEALGRLLAQKLENLLELKQLALPEWFAMMDVGVAGGGAAGATRDGKLYGASSDGMLTIGELGAGLVAMTRGRNWRHFRFTDAQISVMLRYLDPNGDGELSLEEVDDGLRRARLDDHEADEEAYVGSVMGWLEEHMTKHRISHAKLFDWLDENRSGSISPGELQKGLQALLQEDDLKLPADFVAQPAASPKASADSARARRARRRRRGRGRRRRRFAARGDAARGGHDTRLRRGAADEAPAPPRRRRRPSAGAERGGRGAGRRRRG